MMSLRKVLVTGALAFTVSGGAIALSAPPASADVACNRYGECWHVSQRYTTYPSALGMIFHDDAWRDAHRRGYHWRKERHDDHGYYSRGHWRRF